MVFCWDTSRGQTRSKRREMLPLSAPSRRNKSQSKKRTHRVGDVGGTNHERRTWGDIKKKGPGATKRSLRFSWFPLRALSFSLDGWTTYNGVRRTIGEKIARQQGINLSGGSDSVLGHIVTSLWELFHIRRNQFSLMHPLLPPTSSHMR